MSVATVCVIVGGGPAGLAAARAAARYGVRVTLIDDGLALGGRHYRQMPPGFRAPAGSRLARVAAEGRALIDEVLALGVDVRLQTTAWGIFEGRTLAIASADGSERLPADVLVLAPGAYDRPVPFPGWTLPRVMTASAAWSLMRGQGVRPGDRVLLAGSGLDLLLLGRALLGAGARLAAVCEAASLAGGLWQAPRLATHLDVVQEATRARSALRRAGVPLLTGHVIRRAVGDGAVDGATISRCNDDWSPLGEERALDVDTIVVGYGAMPSSELARLAGCAHAWDAARAVWKPTRTREMESTVPGVYVVGGGAGAIGAAAGLAEGHAAGLAIAARFGRLAGREHARAASRARGRLLHLEGLRRATDALYRFGPGIGAIADDGTIVCRCEEVTRDEALQAVREGASHVNEVKAWTRIGMGRCQGRMCGAALAEIVARATGRTLDAVGTLSIRPPARPVPLGALVP